MAWYNPSTWSPVDKIQEGLGGGFKASPSTSGYNRTGVSSVPSNRPSTKPGINIVKIGTGVMDSIPKDSGNVLGSNTDVVDPYAQWGGRSGYDNMLSGFNNQEQGIYDSANSSINRYARGYGNSVTDYLEDARLGQGKIDTMGAKNELARMSGVSGVQGMVGRGINSAGVMLGNRNAGDSSAAGAIANAYGQLGQRQMANVGNQYEMGNMDIAEQQNAFNVQKERGKRNLEVERDNFVSQVTDETANQLRVLDAQMAEASMPERIAIEQEKQKIKQNAVNALKGFQQTLRSGYSEINPNSREANMAKGNELRDAGTMMNADMFNYTTEAPMTAQGSVPAGGNLPIYTLPRGRRQE